MKRWGYVIVLVALGAGACWKTKPNPAFGHDGGVDGGGDGSVDLATSCANDSDCTVAAPHCDIATGVCGACTSSASCAGRGLTLTCDTTAGDALAGQCVGCLTESDCATAGQACVANSCATCTQNSECENGICDTGICVARTNIVFVDNVTCKTGAANGTSDADAYCDVNTAFADIAGARKYVRVAGTGASNLYAPIVWSNGPATVSIVGPGKSAAIGAYVQGVAVPAFAMSNPSGTSSVKIDGLFLQSLEAAGLSCVVSAAGVTATVTIVDSDVHNGGDVGISSTKCSLNVFQSLITANHGGMAFMNSIYDIENNFIVQNSSMTAPGVSFDSGSTGKFLFNTVANNNTSTTGVAGGISCGSAVKTITSSIVYGNTPTSPTMGSQFDGTCNLVGTVTGPDSDNPDAGLAPTFVTPSNFHLSPDAGANAACCIDVADMGPPVNLDIDDEKRPKGVRYDVGADEAR